ncbi:MAG: calcium-binding protein [Pseudomonadota bacterium]
MAFNITFPGHETDGDDLVLGSKNPDFIDAKGGNDLVLAGAGNDTVFGGDGHDTLSGDNGHDILVGDRGDDEMFGGRGDDLMVWNNGDGSDKMNGGSGYDAVQVNGADGAGDSFTIGAGETHGTVQFNRQNLGQFQLDISETELLEVNGQGGDDTITASEGLAGLIKLKLDGGDGDDLIIGSDGEDLIYGGKGNDVLVGAKGNDVVYGGDGDDLLVWNNGDGSDQMIGGKGYDTVQVNGADAAGDEFTIQAGETDGTVTFNRQNLGLFQLDISEVELLDINGQGGNDTITASEGLAGVVSLDLDGGAGDDEITGSDGADILRGGEGNDILIGAKGDDEVFGGKGDDLMVWNNGDGSDLMVGGRGYDTVQVNGADGPGDDFTIKAGEAEGSVEFTRQNLGLFQLDIFETEMLEVNGQGGNDTITGSEGLAGLIKLKLDGGAGHDLITGSDGEDLIYGRDGNDILIGAKGDDEVFGGKGDDLMVWNNGDGSDKMVGGKGYDRVQVNGADGAGDSFTIKAGPTDGSVEFARENLGLFQLDITETEVLEVNGQGGDDTIVASEDLAGVIALKLDGGDGDDLIIGSDGEDVIYGGDGNDILIGAKGNDEVFGGDGNDKMVWNNGDGSDRMVGGEGFDIVEVNGATGAGDIFTVDAGEHPGSVEFARENLGQFQLDISETERMRINGGGGDDEVTGSDGLKGVVTLFVDGGAGNDTLTGGGDKDTIRGGEGDDLIDGGKGKDILAGRSGNDTFVWNQGDGSDEVRGGSGKDRLIVNASDYSADDLEISGDGTTAYLERADGGNFELSLRSIEVLEVNAGGGNDAIIAGQGLPHKLKLDLDGGAGSDLLVGGSGDDTLSGGADDNASDVLVGGAGADTFVFIGDFGVDVVLGFNIFEDTIVIAPNPADNGPGWYQDGDDVVYATETSMFTVEDALLTDVLNSVA